MSVISGLNGTDLFVTLEALPDDFENQLYLFTVSPAVDQFTTLFSVLGSNIFSIFFFMFNRHHSNWFIFIWLHKTFKGGTYFLIPFVGLVIAPCPTVNCTRVLFSDDHTASLALLIEKKTI